MNPPFSAKLRWLRRAYAQWGAGNVRTVLCLMPASVDSAFFHEAIRPAGDVFILKGRLKFADEAGDTQPTPHALMLVALGVTARQKELFEARVPGFWLPKREEAGAAGPRSHFGRARGLSLEPGRPSDRVPVGRGPSQATFAGAYAGDLRSRSHERLCPSFGAIRLTWSLVLMGLARLRLSQMRSGRVRGRGPLRA